MEKDNQPDVSYNRVLNVPLLYSSIKGKTYQLKKLFADMFKETTIEDYSCERCRKKGLIMI
mgnify:CR=1 FL=1